MSHRAVHGIASRYNPGKVVILSSHVKLPGVKRMIKLWGVANVRKMRIKNVDSLEQKRWAWGMWNISSIYGLCTSLLVYRPISVVKQVKKISERSITVCSLQIERKPLHSRGSRTALYLFIAQRGQIQFNHAYIYISRSRTRWHAPRTYFIHIFFLCVN